MQRYLKNSWAVILLLLALNLLVWHVVDSELPADRLRVAFLDVGQGDAILIESPNGNQVLIDGGPDGKVIKSLAAVLPFYDRSLDLVITSHPDADHITGLVDIFDRFEVSGYLHTDVRSESKTLAALQSRVKREAARDLLARQGMRIILEPDVYLDILFPIGSVENWKTNDSSIVSKLTYGDTSFIFPGDSPDKIENYLANREGNKLQADVLKVSHHGSKNSSSPGWLSLIAPKIAVISVGKNSYGHPHQEVLSALSSSKVEVFRTDQDGTVILESDGKEIGVIK